MGKYEIFTKNRNGILIYVVSVDVKSTQNDLWKIINILLNFLENIKNIVVDGFTTLMKNKNKNIE